MPTSRKATCSPPAASTASIRRACRWPRSTKVERRADSAFARITCAPAGAGGRRAARDGAGAHPAQLPPRPPPKRRAGKKPSAARKATAVPRPQVTKGRRHDHASWASSCCCRPTRSSSGAACCWRCWSTCCRWAARRGCPTCWRWCWCSGACTSRCASASARPSCSASPWTCTRPALLGQHALAYTALSFFAITIHRRLLWFSVPSQAVQVLPLFAAAHAIELAIRMLAGGVFPGLGVAARARDRRPALAGRERHPAGAAAPGAGSGRKSAAVMSPPRLSLRVSPARASSHD